MYADRWYPVHMGVSLLQDTYADLTTTSPRIRVLTDSQVACWVFSLVYVLQKQDLMPAHRIRDFPRQLLFGGGGRVKGEGESAAQQTRSIPCKEGERAGRGGPV